MTSELRIIELQQNMITQLNQEIDGLHDALGILRAEIEELQTTIAELEAENLRLKQQFTWPEVEELYNWPKAGPPVKCADARDAESKPCVVISGARSELDLYQNEWKLTKGIENVPIPME